MTGSYLARISGERPATAGIDRFYAKREKGRVSAPPSGDAKMADCQACGLAMAVLSCNNESMEAVVRTYNSLKEMKADEYRYWQSRPVQERMDAVEEMIETAYAIKGWEMEPDVPRLQRPFVRLPCPWR